MHTVLWSVWGNKSKCLMSTYTKLVTTHDLIIWMWYQFPIWTSNLKKTLIVWLSCCGTDSMLEFVWKGRNMGIGYPTDSVLLLLGNPAPCPIFWSFSMVEHATALWPIINDPIWKFSHFMILNSKNTYCNVAIIKVRTFC